MENIILFFIFNLKTLVQLICMVTLHKSKNYYKFIIYQILRFSRAFLSLNSKPSFLENLKTILDTCLLLLHHYHILHCESAFTKMITIIGNLSLKPRQGCFCFTSHQCTWKKHESICSHPPPPPPAMGK